MVAFRVKLFDVDVLCTQVFDRFVPSPQEPANAYCQSVAEDGNGGGLFRRWQVFSQR